MVVHGEKMPAVDKKERSVAKAQHMAHAAVDQRMIRFKLIILRLYFSRRVVLRRERRCIRIDDRLQSSVAGDPGKLDLCFPVIKRYVFALSDARRLIDETAAADQRVGQQGMIPLLC